METMTTNRLVDEITDFLVSTPTLEEIIAFKPSEVLDERVHYLLDLNSEGEITPEEHKELEKYIELDHVMTMLKLKARLKLAGKA